MEMHQVRYFLAVAEEANFTRAAEKCNVSQPSLSRAIQQLEHEFGGPLFWCERGRMVPLKLGIMSTISPDEIVDLIGALETKYSGLELKLCDANARELRMQLLDGKLECVIYALPGEEADERTHVMPLFSEQMVIAVGRSHRLANAKGFPAKQLDGERYIHRQNCEFAGYADHILQEKGVTCTPSYWSERDDWTLAMVAAGLGFAFMPVNAVKHPDVVGVPVIDPEFWRQVNLVTVRGRPHSTGVGALVREAMRKTWFGQKAMASAAADGKAKRASA
jgi:DNA-binding transcriptional LysR family regulator